MRTAILGASGLVGRTMLALLADAPWVTASPRLLTSPRSAGTTLTFRGEALVCTAVGAGSFAGVDLALFSAGAGPGRTWAPLAAAAGAWVVDNSSAWRLDAQVPLVVPEINGDRVPSGRAGGGIIANPNCSTIQIALALAPLARAYGLREAHVTTLQAVSGAGQNGRDELLKQAADLAAGERTGAERGSVFPRRVAANAVPVIGSIGDDGVTLEERKVGDELRKILALPDIAVTCTATRVPVWNGHAAAVRAVFARPVPLAEAHAALGAWPGVAVGPTPDAYLTPAEISGRTDVHVGRLRHEAGRPDVVLMWIVADNLLRGAAWNAVQIAAQIAATLAGRASP